MIKLFGIDIDIIKIILPIIYIIIGIIIFSVIKKIILDSGKNSKKFKVLQNQRVKTLKTLIINVVKYIIFLINSIIWKFFFSDMSIFVFN